MSVTDSSPPEDRRQYFRVADEVVLAWARVDGDGLAALAERLRGEGSEGYGFGPLYAALTQDAQGLLAQLRSEQPLVAQYTENLERRLDILASAIVLADMGVHERSARHVNLSAGGIEFEAETALETDATLELRFVIHPNRSVIVAGARVARCLPADPRSAWPWRIAVEFICLREQDRQMIVRHVMFREARHLRERQPFDDGI
ncbi:PilZ domain-containing protein [Plasticicumulans sp.]|uniref:PilZ domain-containing protein n=1 Tax=Plasticicumulans sp. TaxID=2307179 RepID=UPI000FA4DEF4|nr:PilZ domain-containing protein [Plasticicumulans sp.]MBS0599687.1 PilZ domain-containing protein [Pseudomonadota bacterium]RTK95674.1 MAG: PilZ domain-containing protein [Xanthomonadales bacterium]HMW31644.1 PilZ domain-containing protein [Plasticicumulans sp.]HMW41383.1 PilZ domain-containing protein [Plasticicumulans sp.]HMX54458.1 PilZ domain-containing protein [Plasticicumulans sp.]